MVKNGQKSLKYFGHSQRAASDLGVRSEASGESEARGTRLLFRSFEANSSDYLTKTIEIRDRFPAAAVEHPKSDSLLEGRLCTLIPGWILDSCLNKSSNAEPACITFSARSPLIIGNIARDRL